ncbi:MAG: tRNA (uridine(54)-C5)-methyltransferase TrmA [Pseudomonadales bacterium]
MSNTVINPAHYPTQLAEKTGRLTELLRPFSAPRLAIFSSPVSHYRMRAEFKFWHEGDDCFYVMTDRSGNRVRTDQFPVACHKINQLMPALIVLLQSNEILRRKLFQVDFLAATTEEAVITLTYHKPVDEAWQAQAVTLQAALGCSIIGRSRGKKIVIGHDFVTEQFTVAQETFIQQQPESAFSQPNAAVNQQMLAWAYQHAQHNGGDFLELYCGNGNFTLPLSRCFDKVLATEISKASIKALEHNVAANHCKNIALARLSSEEFTQALRGDRPFRRLAHLNLADYQFSTVLVDPPRAGLDEDTCALIQRFDNILYISCNPETLAHNLQTLSQTHRIEHAALFDQFPYTHHMECGIVLRKQSAGTPDEQ